MGSPRTRRHGDGIRPIDDEAAVAAATVTGIECCGCAQRRRECQAAARAPSRTDQAPVDQLNSHANAGLMRATWSQAGWLNTPADWRFDEGERADARRARTRY
jgi:hypothetical protein